MAIVENNSSGLEGSLITCYCQWSTGMPTEHMVSICLSNGSWSPDPQDMECPSLTTIDYSLITNTTTLTADVSSSNGKLNGLVVPVTATLLVAAVSFVVIILIFITVYIAHWKGIIQQPFTCLIIII